MSVQAHLDSHQSLAGAALPGCWKLDAGRAVTLRPREAGIVRIAHGGVWVTLDGAPHGWGRGNESGDLFLSAGKGIVVQAGQRLVMEPFGAPQAGAAYFAWEPLAQPQQQTIAAAGAVRADNRWQQAVAMPVRDLGLALGLAAAALGRLTIGVLGLGEFLVAGRGRVLARRESNPP